MKPKAYTVIDNDFFCSLDIKEDELNLFLSDAVFILTDWGKMYDISKAKVKLGHRGAYIDFDDGHVWGYQILSKVIIDKQK